MARVINSKPLYSRNDHGMLPIAAPPVWNTKVDHAFKLPSSCGAYIPAGGETTGIKHKTQAKKAAYAAKRQC